MEQIRSYCVLSGLLRYSEDTATPTVFFAQGIKSAPSQEQHGNLGPELVGV